MNFGFPAEKRLKKGWQFDLVFRTGRRETGALVRLLFLTDMGGTPKAGVAVGKKIACAAERSRGRRIMREALRRLMPWIKDGVWVVASLKESALDAPSCDIYRDMAMLLKRGRLMTRGWGGVRWDIDTRKNLS